MYLVEGIDDCKYVFPLITFFYFEQCLCIFLYNDNIHIFDICFLISDVVKHHRAMEEVHWFVRMMAFTN